MPMVENVDTPQYVVPFVSFQTATIKRQILLGYSLIVILALPLWWYTTSIQRLSLPVDRVKAVERMEEVIFSLDVIIKDEHSVTSNVRNLARTVQRFVDKDRSRYPASWEGLQIHIHDGDEDVISKNAATYTVQLHPEDDGYEDKPVLWTDGRTLNVISSPSNDLLAQAIGSFLCESIAPYKRGTQGMQERSTARYSRSFRLAFSLLSEDSPSDITGLGWEVEKALNYYFYPICHQLKQLHNFTIESQVQFYAPLAFDPPSSISSTEETHYVLGEEELKIFINSAEWTLSSSVSGEPVLHFVLFIPSAVHHPLRISKGLDAFIVPQWGGVVILNDLDMFKKGSRATHLEMSDLANPFAMFQAQLLSLLGMPIIPTKFSTTSPEQSQQLSEWQLDALYRQRTIENLKDSTGALSSIVKLVDQIQNMPVGLDVRGDVENALDAIEKVSSNSMNFSKTLHLSANANELSSRAFFNPGMLALLYFPPEHKYAVYIPLFGPITLPFMLVLLKEAKKWLQERRASKLKLE